MSGAKKRVRDIVVYRKKWSRRGKGTKKAVTHHPEDILWNIIFDIQLRIPDFKTFFNLKFNNFIFVKFIKQYNINPLKPWPSWPYCYHVLGSLDKFLLLDLLLSMPVTVEQFEITMADLVSTLSTSPEFSQILKFVVF